MRLPIGYDNFGKARRQQFDIVDKSLFIEEFFEDRETEVSVITRPRRFGKTFNLSMLHHFLAAEVNGEQTKGLFAGLKITQSDNGGYMQHQGQYPVIFVTFKNIKEKSYTSAIDKIQILIQEFFRVHQYLVKSDKLTMIEKELFTKFVNNKITQEEAASAIYNLSELLYKHYGKQVYILIDEYDTPMQAGYLNNYYQEIVPFIRSLLGAALKGNPYLNRAVVTGILRIAKESIFSDLNNVEVYSILQSEYSQHFGFTEAEVNELLKKAHLEAQAEEIKKWYNGYRFGNTIVYNPWSIAHVIKKGGDLQPYWVNTSDNALIRDLLINSNIEFKEQLEHLLTDQPIEAFIDEHMVFADLKTNPSAFWSLLLMSGYLKVESTVTTEQGTSCKLAIPNVEVRRLYRSIIENWLSNGKGITWYNSFILNLLNGEIPLFEEKLNYILLHVLSVYDMSQEPEAFYHGLMLGFTVSLDQTQYEIKSNRESGLGRYDMVIIPKNLHKPAIVMEFKSVTFSQEEPKQDFTTIRSTLAKEAEKALEQINQKKYIAEITQRGIDDIIKIGLAFAGKQFCLKAERTKK